jgi:hypothetical protein
MQRSHKVRNSGNYSMDQSVYQQRVDDGMLADSGTVDQIEMKMLDSMHFEKTGFIHQDRCRDVRVADPARRPEDADRPRISADGV